MAILSYTNTSTVNQQTISGIVNADHLQSFPKKGIIREIVFVSANNASLVIRSNGDINTDYEISVNAGVPYLHLQSMPFLPGNTIEFLNIIGGPISFTIYTA